MCRCDNSVIMPVLLEIHLEVIYVAWTFAIWQFHPAICKLWQMSRGRCHSIWRQPGCTQCGKHMPTKLWDIPDASDSSDSSDLSGSKMSKRIRSYYQSLIQASAGIEVMICAKKHQQPICALDADRGWWPLCDRKEPITSLYLLRGAKKHSCKATLPIYRMFRFEYFELWFSFIRGLSFHFIIIKAGRSASAPRATNICSTSIALLIFSNLFLPFFGRFLPLCLGFFLPPTNQRFSLFSGIWQTITSATSKTHLYFSWRKENAKYHVYMLYMCIHYNTGSTIFIDIDIS